MRRGVAVFLGLLLLVVEVACWWLFFGELKNKDKTPFDNPSFQEKPNEDEPTDVPPGEDGKHAVYKVSYVGVIDGEEGEIPEFLYSAAGSYPTLYISGRETEVSDLLGKMERVEWEGFEGVYAGSGVPDPENARKDWSFYGWYWDKELENEFSGVIGSEQTGAITLYAKIDIGYWTGNH